MDKLFSYKKRPMHLGPYPLEKLKRSRQAPDYSALPTMQPLAFTWPSMPLSIVNAMDEYQATLDCLREGQVKPEKAQIPEDPKEHSDHLKAFGYFCDASMMGACDIPSEAWLTQSITNPSVQKLAEKLASQQVQSLASGIDMILAMVREATAKPLAPCQHHPYALVILYEYPRDPHDQEVGCDWFTNAQAHRAALRAAETASVLASYIRCLGYEARAHSASCSDIDLSKLALASGLTAINKGQNSNLFVGTRFGLAAVTSTLPMQADAYLQPSQKVPTQLFSSHVKQRKPSKAFHNRLFKDGAYAFEKIPRVVEPTTYIDAANVPRVPKRADMFARSLFGDMGPKNQEAAKNGNYVRKSATAFAFRPALGALSVLQGNELEVRQVSTLNTSITNPLTNADKIKATAYWLGCDAVGISACPDWVYYSHNAAGEAIKPYHSNAISIVIDQGHETMEGASGDDWIPCAQSMRAYLRFSLLGGVLAEQIRRLGYSAKVHTVISSDVIQPPLTLLAGLGEVSRIGEVILNPLLGPRLKSGTITTNMPLAHDKPIDFGLQKFCQHCNKCARECPSGAITTGPKLMFNGYEIWKSDSQKCTTYRITTEGGAMCGRCMKTCPWNLEGVFAELPFRWLASHLPQFARVWASIDDKLNNGNINPTKKWWWDLEMREDGPYRIPLKQINERALQPKLEVTFDQQTLAVYPANLLPPPYPFPAPMDREAGIAAYQSMIPVHEYQQRRAKGLPLEHQYHHSDSDYNQDDAPVIQVIIDQVEPLSDTCTRYRFVSLSGKPLPKADAGAHIDVLVAPEYLRQYSLVSNQEQQDYYDIVVLREDQGRGGSQLMHRIFQKGRKVFIGKPINHFPVVENATFSYLMGGGIGITPMVAMAHRLHHLGRPFALHYSASRAQQAAFAKTLQAMPWADQVHYHFSDQGQRADLEHILHYQKGSHVYTCGPDNYMQAVLDIAQAQGFADDHRHMEYFNPPEQPQYINHPFTLKLAKSQREINVPADKTATQALNEAGIHIELKCSDGICGVCQCKIISGTVEHRDFVLSNAQRKNTVILCQSRAAESGGILEVEL